MDIRNVKFRKNKDYYFNVESNTIYGEKKYSYEYFHETVHLTDHKNKNYREFSFFMSLYSQMLPVIYVISMIIAFFMHNIFLYLKSLSIFLAMYGFLAAHLIVEESRAYIIGYMRYRRWKKQK